MLTKPEREIAESLAQLMLGLMTLTEPPPLAAHFASADAVKALYDNLIQLRDILYAVSTGDLSMRIPLNGYMGGTLKSLQSNLRHMTWQTQMVSSGDFSQRVDFMGEFSDSFNAMVIQLEQTLNELMRKKEQLSEANADLLAEIAVRKQTEADLLKSREELRLLATTDSLTGLYNRGHFNTVAEGEIERALRYSRPLSVLMFDIDHFKRINDRFGHSTGDRVLKKIAHTSAEIFRSTDMLARYGGEEFVAFLYETGASEAAMVAERLRKRIEKAAVHSEKGPITVTASFGISDYFERIDASPSSEVLSNFISTADLALYASKKAGRNRVTIFNPQLHAMDR